MIANACRDGRLVQAATRGDGREGEDVTHNVSMRGAVQGLPVSVPALAGDRAMPAEYEVRGEVYITLDDFAKVCLCGHGSNTMLTMVPHYSWAMRLGGGCRSGLSCVQLPLDRQREQLAMGHVPVNFN